MPRSADQNLVHCKYHNITDAASSTGTPLIGLAGAPDHKHSVTMDPQNSLVTKLFIVEIVLLITLINILLMLIIIIQKNMQILIKRSNEKLLKSAEEKEISLGEFKNIKFLKFN